MNSKNAKYTLITSVIALFVSVIMLVGVTFAWFTDTAGISVNAVKTGSFDIALLDSNGNSLEGKTLNWVSYGGDGTILWEPGCSYSLPEVTVANKGNLALKYKLAVSGIDGNVELLDVINFSVTINGKEVSLNSFEGELLPGEDASFVLKGTMSIDAGNEYQNKTINGIAISVQATQLAHESDSNGSNYDKNASYPDDVTTTTSRANNAVTTEPEATTAKEEETTKPAEVSVNVERIVGSGDTGSIIVNSSNVSADALVLVENTKATMIKLSGNSNIDVENVVVISEDCDGVPEIQFLGGSYNLPSGGRLVKNNSDKTAEVIVFGEITVNGNAVNSITDLQLYCENCNITVEG